MEEFGREGECYYCSFLGHQVDSVDSVSPLKPKGDEMKGNA